MSIQSRGSGKCFEYPRNRPTRYEEARGPFWSTLDLAMKWSERIVIDPTVLAGKPIVRGTRLAVELIVGLLGEGWSESDILRNYPGLTHEDVAACLQYASEVLHAENQSRLSHRTGAAAS
jgi:uncharacterized protein (DUF433 family)